MGEERVMERVSLGEGRKRVKAIPPYFFPPSPTLCTSLIFSSLFLLFCLFLWLSLFPPPLSLSFSHVSSCPDYDVLLCLYPFYVPSHTMIRRASSRVLPKILIQWFSTGLPCPFMLFWVSRLQYCLLEASIPCCDLISSVWDILSQREDPCCFSQLF